MPQADEPLTQVVIIQAICTHWEKSARGGPNAVLRNRVPEAAKVADVKVASGLLTYATQYVYYSSRNNFAEPTRTVIGVPATIPPQSKGISFDFDGRMLTVFYQYDRSQGAPERFIWKTEALNLSRGQWGRIRYNGRHSGMEGYWWYEKWVWNVGLFNSVSPSAFLKTEPVKVTSYMGHLK